MKDNFWKVVHVGELQTGNKDGRDWAVREVVFEEDPDIPVQYPQQIVGTLRGDKAKEFNLKEKERCSLAYSMNAREYNGRYYQQILVWDYTPTF